MNLCKECVAKYRRLPITRKSCIDCGREYDGPPVQKRCKACARKVANARSRLPTARPLGSVDTCLACGCTYTVAAGSQKYCPACSDKARKANASAAALKRYRAKKDAGIPVRGDRTVRRLCAVCGTPFVAADASTTCSPACAEARRKDIQRAADAKRRKTKDP